MNKTFDCVLSLETGEHIPQQYESNFIDNIVTHSQKLIILSWAVPNQGGEGHFNERDNKYIIKNLRNENLKSTRKKQLN